MTVIHNR